jgi:uncharacterized protein (DUF983 family)
MLLRCCACGTENDFGRNWVESEDACSKCGTRGRWRRYADPADEWMLNENDKRLLKSFHIAQD